MAHWTELASPHGTVNAWRADPTGPCRGALLVVQEIFGVNAHIRTVTQRLADAGFCAVAPALFDAIERDVELDYDEAGLKRGRALVAELGTDRAVAILGAADAMLQHEGQRVGAIGFCWGGSLAFLCNTRLGLPAVGYYGARSMPHLDEPTRAPMLFHFGGRDDSTPAADIEQHRRKHPKARVCVYPDAGHAFNRDVDPSTYDAESAALAWQRSTDFLAENLR